MAKQELTPRQTEIKALMEQGKKPKDIAKKLKISENAVYQQIRRIREGGASGRSTSGAARKSGGSTTRSTARSSRSDGRQSSGSRPARRAAAPRPVAVPQTAEELLKSEIAAHDAQIAEHNAAIEAAKESITGAEAAIAAVQSERERKAATLSVLTGEMVAHAKPKPAARRSSSSSSRRSSGQSGSKSTGKAASGQQGGSQATSNGSGSTPPTPPAPSGDGEGTKEAAPATA